MSQASPTITACILARNEERRIEAALQSLAGWTDQIILIDNESEDNTVAIARRYTDHILTAPRSGGVLGVGCSVLGPTRADAAAPNTQHRTPNTQHPTPNTQTSANFDAARNLAIPHAAG